jgi:hypothetical protein
VSVPRRHQHHLLSSKSRVQTPPSQQNKKPLLILRELSSSLFDCSPNILTDLCNTLLCKKTNKPPLRSSQATSTCRKHLLQILLIQLRFVEQLIHLQLDISTHLNHSRAWLGFVSFHPLPFNLIANSRMHPSACLCST